MESRSAAPGGGGSEVLTALELVRVLAMAVIRDPHGRQRHVHETHVCTCMHTHAHASTGEMESVSKIGALYQHPCPVCGFVGHFYT